MSLKNYTYAYGIVTKLFHIILIILVFFQFGSGILMTNIENKAINGVLFMFHKSTGLLVLLWVFLFMLWSILNIKPVLPLSMPAWERVSAHINHILLYVLVLSMALSGWIMSSAAGYPPSFYRLFTVPAPFIAKIKNLDDITGWVHYFVAWILGFLLFLHIAAAFRHHYFKRDIFLSRMF